MLKVVLILIAAMLYYPPSTCTLKVKHSKEKDITTLHLRSEYPPATLLIQNKDFKEERFFTRDFTQKADKFYTVKLPSWKTSERLKIEYVDVTYEVFRIEELEIENE